MNDSEILEYFEEADDPVLSTSDMADCLDMTTQGAYNRLDDLRDRGLVDSKKIGNSVAWWISDDGRRYLTGDIEDADDERDS